MPEERIHIIQYAGLGVLIFPFQGKTSWDKITLGYAFGLILLIGMGDEIIQWLLPNRVFDVRDILFNFLGGILGIGVRLYISNFSIKKQMVQVGFQ